MSVQHMSSAGSGLLGQVDIPGSPVGFLCRDVPLWVSHPPIESAVFAWGASEDHQLGLDTEQDIFQPKVVESLLGIHFMGRSFGRCPLVGGSRNTLALDADGGLWSWGWNDRGTLGHGHRALQRKPAPVEGLNGIEVIQAAIGGWHCLALDSDGQVYCWGGNEYQQCGLIAPEDDQQPTAAAAAAAGGQAGSSGGGGGGGANGNSNSRGGGRSSEAANGSCYGVLPAVRDILIPCRCMPGLKVKQVACGGMNSVVLTEAGEVWTWGEPWGDFLAMDIQRAPRKVEGAVNIAAIACGGFHNLALVADGSVLSWGTNDYGQLGNGSTIYSTTPVEVCDLEEVAVADIAAGGWHSMALTADGQIYVWGRGEYGRLGIGDRTGSSKLRPHKIRGLEEHVVVQVAAGGTHSCCVTSSGRMFIWGRASYGRLGLGADARDAYSPVEVQLPGGHQRWKIAAATSGGRHTMCLAVPVRDGIKGTSQYGGNSDGPSRAASVVNEPINAPAGAGSNGRGNNGSSNAAAGADAAGGSIGQQQRQQQQQQGTGRVYDPFATQQQQQQQVRPGSSSGGGGGRAEDGSTADRNGSGGSNAAAGAPGGGSSRGLSAVGVSSPYQPGGALPHGPTLSMQSSYSLVNSPGSSIGLGGSSPATNFSTSVPGGLAATGPWAGGPVLRPGAAAAAAAAAPGSSPGAPAAAAAAAAGGSGSGGQGRPGSAGLGGAGRPGSGTQGSSSSVVQGGSSGAAGFSVSPLPSPRGGGRSAGGASAAAATAAAAAAALSPRGGGGGAAHAGSGSGSSSAVPGSAAAMAAAAAAAAAGGSSEVLPLGVEAVHAATEAAVQHVSVMLHGLSPGTPGAATSGALHAMLTSHGPLAAAAAAAAAGGGSLKPGQGSSISPRGIPPPMSPSQRAAGWDAGSSLREFAGTGDAYEVTGRGDSIQWQHQDVALELQEREVLVEDDALQQELHEEQQREADEAALEEAEERQEEEVRLRRQEHQQQLREAHMRQRHQQLPGQPGSQGAGSNQGGSHTGLGFVAPGSSGSSGGRMGSSQGRSSFAAAAAGAAGAPAGSIQQQQQQQQQMRRSHSHQQLAAAVAAAAAEMGGTGQSYGSLQRYGSSPQTNSSGGTAGQPGGGQQQQQQHQAGVSSVSFGGAGGAAAGGASGRLAPAGAPVSFSAGVAGVRRMGAGGSVWPAVARVDSDASQEGLVGLVEGASPTDSPRSSAAAGDGPSRSASHSRGSRTDRPGQMSRGSQGSISGDSSGAAELGASPPSGRYDVGLGERYVGSLPGREQLHHLAHT